MNRLGIEFVYEHDVALANRIRAGLGMPLRPSCHVISTADEIDALTG